MQFELSLIRFVIINSSLNRMQFKFKAVLILLRGTELARTDLYNSADYQFTALALAFTGIKSWHVRLQYSLTSNLISFSFLLYG
jgi:hypothetical protein